MRLPSSNHAVIKVARLQKPHWDRSSHNARSFTSTVSAEAPVVIRRVDTDVPLHIIQGQPNPKAKKVAVVGGGISGLAAAHSLTKELPDAKITLFEAKNKLGGWLSSELIPVDEGEVLFEWGPRTLRNNAEALRNYNPTAQLMAHLNMAEDIVPIPARSAAALNRYIYYPDHLVRMPGPDPARGLLGNIASGLVNIGREPIFAGAVQNLINEVSIDVRPNTVQDESVGDFVTRRFGPTVAENLVSAILHGIYAGDLYKLSIKTIFPLFWHLEKISRAGILGELGKQMWRREKLILWDDFVFDFASSQTSQIAESDAFGALREKLEGSSVYTFKKGLAQLSEKIEADLQENKNVQIKHISAALAFDAKTKRFAVTNADSQEGGSAKTSDSYDYVVATIPPSQLSQALKQPKHMTQSSPFANMLSRLETAVSSVNVMVINLFYRNPSLVPVSGFGYLIPRSVPIDQNPERALGVIFGSETSRGSSTDPSSSTGQDSAIGTKLTVMMGGHWWNSWSPSDLPDEETAIKMARAVLKRHLGITDPPIVAKARMQWNAIPQYEVGHNERMGRLHEDLRREFDGRLKVAGSSYQGVGVNDCIKAGKKAALDIREGLDERTGLENFGADVRYALLKLREGAVFFRGWAEEAPDLEDE